MPELVHQIEKLTAKTLTSLVSLLFAARLCRDLLDEF
jgi:hypothetical protein